MDPKSSPTENRKYIRNFADLCAEFGEKPSRGENGKKAQLNRFAKRAEIIAAKDYPESEGHKQGYYLLGRPKRASGLVCRTSQQETLKYLLCKVLYDALQNKNPDDKRKNTIIIKPWDMMLQCGFINSNRLNDWSEGKTAVPEFIFDAFGADNVKANSSEIRDIIEELKGDIIIDSGNTILPKAASFARKGKHHSKIPLLSGRQKWDFCM